MRSIGDALITLGACPRAVKKYMWCFDFKEAFINCHWQDGAWMAHNLFGRQQQPSDQYPNLPSTSGFDISKVDDNCLAQLFHKKANRIKYWPEVQQRLGEIGLEIRGFEIREKSDHKTRDARAAKKTPGRGA